MMGIAHLNCSRRHFLRLSLASTACAGCSSLAPVAITRSRSPNGKINVAFVGIGHRGEYVFRAFEHYKDLINVVAFCDTEMGGERTLPVLRDYPDVPRYRDFRRMLDEQARNLDAVCVCTPDFSHFPVAMLAMSLGLAVFSEKPLGASFRECGLMAAAARRHRVVTQMGNQGHSGPNYYQCKALTERGYLKDVTRITAHMNGSRRWFKWNGQLSALPPPEPVPAELDWNLWSAQRPQRAFTPEYINGGWRCFYSLGTGAIGDWGAHIFDAAWEFLKLGFPDRIEVRQITGHNRFVYPLSSTLVFHFPARGAGLPACELEWHDGQNNLPEPPPVVTAKGWKMPDYGAELYCADGRVFARQSHEAPLFLIAGGDPRDRQVRDELRDFRRHQPGHYESFLLAVKGEAKTTSPFEIGGGLSQLLALGCVAQQLNEPMLRFDRAAKRFVGNDAANALLDGPAPRPGWEQFASL